MRPLLGTTVAINVVGIPEHRANQAIDAAFESIAHIHARMSFQSNDSDVARLNRADADEVVRIDPDTFAVLRFAKVVAHASNGIFDPTVAAELVRDGLLARPTDARTGNPTGRWDDIILECGAVRLRRPIWLDLSGIAKGYAVDRATEILAAHGAEDGLVDAGGDLRVFGSARQIGLRTGFEAESVPVVRIENGSLASSGGRPDARHAADGQHLHGSTRAPAERERFACVVAETCSVADALTKVVLALGTASEPILAKFSAAAHLRQANGIWHHLGTR